MSVIYLFQRNHSLAFLTARTLSPLWLLQPETTGWKLEGCLERCGG